MESMETAPTTVAGPASLVNFERYLILDLASAGARAVVRAAQQQLRELGASELPDFIRPAALPTLIGDARRLAPSAYRSAGVGSAYLEVPDFELPADHPRRMLGPYGVGVVAYDQFPPGSSLR